MTVPSTQLPEQRVSFSPPQEPCPLTVHPTTPESSEPLGLPYDVSDQRTNPRISIVPAWAPTLRHANVPPKSTSEPLQHSQAAPLGTSASPFPITLKPLIATRVGRYEKTVTQISGCRDKNVSFNFALAPGTKDFTDRRHETRAPEWIAFIHPEGALYFYHAARKIFTDTDVRKEINRTPIIQCADKLREMMAEQNIEWTDDTELVLELDKRKNECGYYFVEKANRCLFWVEPFPAESMLENVKGLKHTYHLRYALELQYWQVISIHKTLMSDTSLAPFQPEELAKMLDIMGHIEQGVGRSSSSYMAIIARLNRQFSRSKFFNFHGHVGARLDADQSIYDQNLNERKSIFLRLLNPILFGAPSIHTHGLRRIWVDRTVNAPRWKNFINKLNSEWSGFTIYSTVMLAVDVSFLAVPGVDSASIEEQSLATVAIYLSTLNAVGSLVVSLILADQSRNQGSESVERAVVFLSRMTQSMLGTEALGIMYSLPYALLMWA
ncbi:hypothetical protein BV22DRAFT_1130364 [Leucogyrophana mollusca]|uniref:Uncharacterized protein n=1 Tax=Leucogyrophana mollusca TaxID=85980 RepID=A0ACB8BF57_9AGAM|nr:hypothetical protein BV22DRAFT_1130364 [Leucogyrophana mollusca]